MITKSLSHSEFLPFSFTFITANMHATGPEKSIRHESNNSYHAFHGKFGFIYCISCPNIRKLRKVIYHRIATFCVLTGMSFDAAVIWGRQGHLEIEAKELKNFIRRGKNYSVSFLFYSLRPS